MSVGRFVDHKLETRYKLNSKHELIIRFMGSFETLKYYGYAWTMCAHFVPGCNAFKFTLNSIHLILSTPCLRLRRCVRLCAWTDGFPSCICVATNSLPIDIANRRNSVKVYHVA